MSLLVLFSAKTRVQKGGQDNKTTTAAAAVASKVTDIDTSAAGDGCTEVTESIQPNMNGEEVACPEVMGSEITAAEGEEAGSSSESEMDSDEDEVAEDEAEAKKGEVKKDKVRL